MFSETPLLKCRHVVHYFFTFKRSKDEYMSFINGRRVRIRVRTQRHVRYRIVHVPRCKGNVPYGQRISVTFLRQNLIRGNNFSVSLQSIATVATISQPAECSVVRYQISVRCFQILL